MTMMHILGMIDMSTEFASVVFLRTPSLLWGSLVVFHFARVLFAKMAGGIGLGLGLLVHSEESRIMWVSVSLGLGALSADSADSRTSPLLRRAARAL